MKEYLTQIGIALSQLLHTLFGGDAKMTTSAKLGRHVKRGSVPAKILCKVISFVLMDPDHCVQSYESDKQRRLNCDQAHDV